MVVSSVKRLLPDILYLLCLLPFANGFLVSNRSSQPIPQFSVASAIRPARQNIPPCYPWVARETLLRAKKSGNNNESESFDDSLLLGDVLAIVVACQLIGLVDALNDEVFWVKGGFAQPIPAVPATLGSFVQRTSLGCLCWIVSCVWGSNDTRVTIPSSAKVLICFVFLQVGLSSAISEYATHTVDFISVTRDCYFAAIMIFGWRYVYRNWNSF